MHKNDQEFYCCRVCGLIQGDQPWGEGGQCASFNICGCCGVTFGYQDCTPEYVKKYRTEWLKKGGKWFTPDEKPADWSLEKQMEGIPEAFR